MTVNISKLAIDLGVSRTTVYTKLEELGLSKESLDDPETLNTFKLYASGATDLVGQLKEVLEDLKARIDTQNTKVTNTLVTHTNFIKTHIKWFSELRPAVDALVKENETLKLRLENLELRTKLVEKQNAD